MVTDPIADYLTRIRNALMIAHAEVKIPFSKAKESMSMILKDQGYIKEFSTIEERAGIKSLKLVLKYGSKNKQPAIMNLERISKPGLRKYAGTKNLPIVINGLGVAIISTSQGIMTNKEAVKKSLGGEVMCHIY